MHEDTLPNRRGQQSSPFKDRTHYPLDLYLPPGLADDWTHALASGVRMPGPLASREDTIWRRQQGIIPVARLSLRVRRRGGRQQDTQIDLHPPVDVTYERSYQGISRRLRKNAR